MAGNIRVNLEELTSTINKLSEVRNNLTNQVNALNTIDTSLGGVWRGVEYEKTSARLKEAERDINEMIRIIEGTAIPDLQNKLAGFSEAKTGL